MALANNTIYYKAPKEILRMADDLSLLPAWFVDEGALVKILNYELNDSLLRHYERLGLCLSAKLDSEYRDVDYRPWGWNRSLIHRLAKEKVSPSHLPSTKEMDKIRCLSGRQMSVQVLKAFAGMQHICGYAVACHTLEQVQSVIEQNYMSIVKSPWSGSGRGLVKIDSNELDDNVRGWIARILRSQGEVMVEPLYNKVIDFAMEFHADNCKVEFRGYSMFETDDHGNYKCNLLASDNVIETQLSQYVPVGLLHGVKMRLLSVFNRMIKGNYNGYFGVDMMICNQDGEYKVHPCVEVNLRMNMGVVARIVYDRHVSPLSHGKYVVEHFFSDNEAMAFALKMKTVFPSVVDGGQFISGYFPLTPLCTTTRFHVYLLLANKDG